MRHWGSGTQAPTGQTSAQLPQSLHFSGLMVYRSVPSVMACSGHSAWQAPQMMHSSVIRWLKLFSPCYRFWQTGQRWVPRPTTRMCSIDSPQVVQGSPLRW